MHSDIQRFTNYFKCRICIFYFKIANNQQLDCFCVKKQIRMKLFKND